MPHFITVPRFDAMELANHALDGESNILKHDNLLTINTDHIQSITVGSSDLEITARGLKFRPTVIAMGDHRIKVAMHRPAVVQAASGRSSQQTDSISYMERWLIQPQNLDILKTRDAQMPLDLDF